MFPVGRLDRDSEGLLLLTNDGDLANRLMHPSHGVEKEYLAEVEANADGQTARAACARAWSSTTVRRAPSELASSPSSKGRGAVRLVMTEGRKREVRRLLAAVGLPVTRLVRLRVGPDHARGPRRRASCGRSSAPRSRRSPPRRVSGR